jgi:hypothetical protein
MEPGKGIHAYRFAGLAIVDVVLTVVAAVLIQRYMMPDICLSAVLLALFLLGIIAHRALDIHTTIDRLMF